MFRGGHAKKNILFLSSYIVIHMFRPPPLRLLTRFGHLDIKSTHSFKRDLDRERSGEGSIKIDIGFDPLLIQIVIL